MWVNGLFKNKNKTTKEILTHKNKYEFNNEFFISFFKNPIIANMAKNVVGSIKILLGETLRYRATTRTITKRTKNNTRLLCLFLYQKTNVINKTNTTKNINSFGKYIDINFAP